MKVLLLEGLDNVGKSTIANELITRYKEKYNILFMHSRSPKPQEGVDPLTYQTAEFLMKADIAGYMAMYEESKTPWIVNPNAHCLSETLCIFDRSWLDEYVYGQIYRNEKPEDIFDMIKFCFRHLTYDELAHKVEPIIVYLDASPEFSIAKDDGKSFTSNIEQYNEKLYQVTKEYNLFMSVLDLCESNNFCKTLMVNVQDGDNYRPLDNIIDDISKQLKL